MPSDQSTWLIAVPHDGDAEGLLPEIVSKLSQQSRSSSTSVAELSIPSFKVCRFPAQNKQTLSAFTDVDRDVGLLDRLV